MLTEANMQASTYYVNQLLQKDRYLRIQPLFNSIEAPASIRNQVVGFDVKDPKHLKAMHEYAKGIFIRNKDSIYEFLEI